MKALGFVLLMACLLGTTPGFAQKSYVAPFSATPVLIDGKLDDAGWSGAPWSDDFVDIEGSIRPMPRFRTTSTSTSAPN
jgi:hypothetical protein